MTSLNGRRRRAVNTAVPERVHAFDAVFLHHQTRCNALQARARGLRARTMLLPQRPSHVRLRADGSRTCAWAMRRGATRSRDAPEGCGRAKISSRTRA